VLAVGGGGGSGSGDRAPLSNGGDFGSGQGGGSVYRVGGGVSAPALIHKVEPKYSEEARKAKYQGTVILYVEISPDGRAVNPRVVRSLGLGLDENAIEAVRKWKFRPGYKDGKAVTVVAQIEVNFRL
jgi:TonB family protein